MTSTILINAQVIDGTGAAPYAAAVWVRDGVIAQIGDRAAFDAPPDTPTLDLSGATLMPGFIDTHVHIWGNPDPAAPPDRITTIPVRDVPYYQARKLLFAVNAARQTLEAGFTTIRDLMAPDDLIFPLRDALAAGEFPGPRILASGRCITLTGGHGVEAWYPNMAITADGQDEVLKAVRTMITAGADCIKFMSGTRAALSPPYRGRPGHTTEEFRVGVDEAHRAGLKVAVHAQYSTEGIKNAVLGGVDSVEHGAPQDEESLMMMRDRGTILCPTLSVYPHDPARLEARISRAASEVARLVRQQIEVIPYMIQRAKELGVTIALGTDCGVPGTWHGRNADEFEWLVSYGLTPMEAIVAGTRNAAQNIGLLDTIGTIEAGKLADLVAFAGDPLADIRLLQQQEAIRLVMQGGRIVKHVN